MKTVTLERFAYTPDGVFGRLKVRLWEFLSVERPWMENKPNVSCIPCGTYQLLRSKFYASADDYPCYEIVKVPGRSLIKIHIANTMDDVKGCIGLGMRSGYIAEKWAVRNSREAFFAFMREMDGADEGQITIKNLWDFATV